MTGPEHYREAGRLIAEANHIGSSDPERGMAMLASAQVHATLALAAATALGEGLDRLPWIAATTGEDWP